MASDVRDNAEENRRNAAFARKVANGDGNSIMYFRLEKSYGLDRPNALSELASVVIRIINKRLQLISVIATLLFSVFISGSFAQSRKYGIIAFSESDHSFFPSPILNFLLGKVGRSPLWTAHFLI